MTGKADFTPEEWHLVLEGPPSAGMIVVTAQRGGALRETIAIAKSYVEARKQHGESQLLDEIVSAKPEMDHMRYHSAQELKDHGLRNLRDAVELLGRKASPEEVADYRRFVLGLADKVATAHREGGEQDRPEHEVPEIKPRGTQLTRESPAGSLAPSGVRLQCAQISLMGGTRFAFSRYVVIPNPSSIVRRNP